MLYEHVIMHDQTIEVECMLVEVIFKQVISSKCPSMIHNFDRFMTSIGNLYQVLKE